MLKPSRSADLLVYAVKTTLGCVAGFRMEHCPLRTMAKFLLKRVWKPSRKWLGISTDIDPKEIGLEGVNLKNPVEVSHAFSVARLLEKQVTARVKTAEMELKAIELEAKKGNFIPKEEVLADARRVASLVREKLLTIPIRYAGQLEGRTQREIEGVLDHAIDEVLQSLNESKFVEQ